MLFSDDIRGYTKIASIENPIVGAWKTQKQKLVINEHALYAVYTQRVPKAIEYFRILKENLEAHKKQLIIVMEQSEITFVPKGPDIKQLLRKIKDLGKENKRLNKFVSTKI